MAGDVLLLAREHLSGRRRLQQLFYGRQQLLLQRMNRKAHPAGGKIFHVLLSQPGMGLMWMSGVQETAASVEESPPGLEMSSSQAFI